MFRTKKKRKKLITVDDETIKRLRMRDGQQTIRTVRARSRNNFQVILNDADN